MINWRSILVPPTVTIRHAAEIIDQGGAQITIVVDEDQRLLGVVTDGDLRRAILHSLSLDLPVTEIMNRDPKVVDCGADRETVLALMQKYVLRHVPSVDHERRVVGLETLNDLLVRETHDNWIVLMAGGLGSRLRPLTHEKPKPLLDVGGQPILETIIQHFVAQGFSRFFISVNYMADKIINHFGDGRRFGAEIQYLREQDQLGTAGALSLLPARPEKPFLVMNGDILTNVKFTELLRFHKEQESMATMCVREHDFQVPYGVVKCEGNKFFAVAEKPVHRFFINAGIYALSPEILDHLRPSETLNMTDLFDSMTRENGKVHVYPIREYWLDIGKAEDFARANEEFSTVFG
ncbi:MAG: nucleotidyltransferase family protein [Rhodospirillaceae bacterium]|nr:nucleotidyltransferase family protein [Rhodospirillales bacterium]